MVLIAARRSLILKFPRSVFIPTKALTATMALVTPLTVDEAQYICDNWPAARACPPSILAAHVSWMVEQLSVIDPEIATFLRTAPGYTTPGRFRKMEKCRILVANRVPSPHGVVADIGELRSLLRAATPVSVDARLDAMLIQINEQAAALSAAKTTIAALERTQGAEDDGDVSADFEIHETVVSALPGSFVSLHPLPKKDRLQIARDHCGRFPEGAWPNPLALKDSTKTCKEMQKAKTLTLPQYALEVAKIMDKNAAAAKVVGTAWSRVLDIDDQLTLALVNEPAIVFRAADFQQQLKPVLAGLEGAFKSCLDTSAYLRSDVGKRVDTAMGIDHLRFDPSKKTSDDFISDDTYKLVKAEAEHKQNMAAAKKGNQSVGNFLGGPPRKDSRGGKANGRGRGRGRGTQKQGSSSAPPKKATTPKSTDKGGGKGKGKTP